MTIHRISYAEDRALKAFNDHPKPETVGQLLAALHAYRDALIENGYLSRDVLGAAPDQATDIRERAACRLTPTTGGHT